MDRTVMDRNLITAQGYAFVDFTVEVCRYLNIFESEQQEYEQVGNIHQFKYKVKKSINRRGEK